MLGKVSKQKIKVGLTMAGQILGLNNILINKEEKNRNAVDRKDKESN